MGPQHSALSPSSLLYFSLVIDCGYEFSCFDQDPAFGERGRLEKFVANTYAPLLTKKPVKALIMAVFGIIFVRKSESHDTC